MSKRRQRRLSCMGKRRFNGLNEAVRSKNLNGNSDALWAYSCKFCPGWHLGHKRAERKDRSVGLFK